MHKSSIVKFKAFCRHTKKPFVYLQQLFKMNQLNRIKAVESAVFLVVFPSSIPNHAKPVFNAFLKRPAQGSLLDLLLFDNLKNKCLHYGYKKIHQHD